MSVNSIDHIAAQKQKEAEQSQEFINTANEQAAAAQRGESHVGTGTTTQTGKVVDLNVMVHPPDLGMTTQNSNYMMFESFTMRGGVGSSTSDIILKGHMNLYVYLFLVALVQPTNKVGINKK